MMTLRCRKGRGDEEDRGVSQNINYAPHRCRSLPTCTCSLILAVPILELKNLSSSSTNILLVISGGSDEDTFNNSSELLRGVLFGGNLFNSHRTLATITNYIQSCRPHQVVPLLSPLPGHQHLSHLSNQITSMGLMTSFFHLLPTQMVKLGSTRPTTQWHIVAFPSSNLAWMNSGISRLT